MQVQLAYRGHSGIRSEETGQTLSLAPNLARDPVAFDAPLLKPLRFREAMSVLHDVVISDLRFKKKDKSAYLEWKKRQQEQSQFAAKAEYDRLAEKARQKVAVPADFEQAYHKARYRYWSARQEYSDHLRHNDPDLWRKLMPCDPVVTVADDVVFFECFSADQSSYGCLSVGRGDGFGKCDNVQFGTTNVDYSWELYHHFQSLRSWRQTRFRVDPAGFEVATGRQDYREEKIDLPAGWLRGFMQLQSAMSLPVKRVSLSRETLYSILAFLKRHRSEQSPRAVRFELADGAPPRIVLEPWEQVILSRDTKYDGPPTEPIRVWGRRRLLALARLLPLAERFDVYLLGTGLPSFWVAQMGEMRLTLGLSGWTTNDWIGAAAVDLIAPPAIPGPGDVERVIGFLHARRSATLAQVQQAAGLSADITAASLRRLAHSGQVIADLAGGVYRWRQIMPRALGEAEIGPEHPELAGAKEIMARRPVRLENRQPGPNGSLALSGNIDGTPCEVLLDAERNVKRGKCLCGYYRKYLLRNGPCRHMIAMRRLAMQEQR